jgi:hypothetical protein
MSTKPVPELVRAAEVLESEMLRLEALSKAVRKIRLDSGKNIARATKELNEALKLPAELGAGLIALGTAMQNMQARQQAALDPLSEFATEIQRRMGRLEEHMQAFAALGKAATDVTELLQEAAERSALLGEVKQKLEAIADGARALVEAARADDFPDVARDADALRQRISSLRKRLEGPASN